MPILSSFASTLINMVWDQTWKSRDSDYHIDSSVLSILCGEKQDMPECWLPAPQFIHSATDFSETTAFVIASRPNAALLPATTTPPARSFLRVHCRTGLS